MHEMEPGPGGAALMHVNARIHHPATAELFFVTRLELPAPGPLPSFGSRASALRTLMQRQPQRQLLSTTHRRITRFRGQPPAKTDRQLPARRTTHDAFCSWLPCPPVVPTLDAGILGTKRAKGSLPSSLLGATAANLVLTALCGDTIRGI
jgi:hypothetical protein